MQGSRCISCVFFVSVQECTCISWGNEKREINSDQLHQETKPHPHFVKCPVDSETKHVVCVCVCMCACGCRFCPHSTIPIGTKTSIRKTSTLSPPRCILLFIVVHVAWHEWVLFRNERDPHGFGWKDRLPKPQPVPESMGRFWNALWPDLYGSVYSTRPTHSLAPWLTELGVERDTVRSNRCHWQVTYMHM